VAAYGHFSMAADNQAWGAVTRTSNRQLAAPI